MKTITALGFVVLVGLTVGLATMVCIERSTISQVRAKLAALELQEAGHRSLVTTKDGTIDMLGAKLEQTTQALTNANGKLVAMSERLLEYQIGAQAAIDASKSKLRQEEVPAPADGVFPRVPNRFGKVLAMQATYVAYPGRRLLFRPAEGMSISVDVDEIHPKILEYLHLDRDAMVAQQSGLDKQWAATSAYRAAQARVAQQQSQDAASRRAREANEKALAEAEMAKANAAQMMADSERAKADAMARAADAAMINALNPQPSVIVQQNQQQIQGQQYRGPVIWK